MDTLTRRIAAVGLMAALAVGLALAAGCSKESLFAPVAPPPLSAVIVLPHDTTLLVGQSHAFSATALDTHGVAVPGVAFLWASTDPAVFTVSNTGVVTASGVGLARLLVRAGGKSDTATVAVLPTTRGWVQQASGASTSLNGVFFRPDGRHGWAVGAGGTIRATQDGGVNWGVQVGMPVVLRAVWFTSDTEGWVVGENGTLLHTTDGGVNWVPGVIAAGAHLNDVCFATPDTGWAVGGSGAIVRTFDHGVTWTQTNPTTANLRGVSFADTRYGWAVGDNGVIVGTSDRGVNWSVVTPAVTTQNLRSVWRTSAQRANAVGAAGAAPRSANDGFGNPVWTLVNPGAAYALEGVCFADSVRGWAVGLNGIGFVLRTVDGGLHWTPQSITAGNRLNDVFFADSSRGWAVGENGQIFSTTSGGRP